MTTPSYNTLFGTPFYSIPGPLYTPTIDGGAYLESLPLTNLQDRRLRRVARSVDALNTSARCRMDLKTDRSPRVIAIPSAYRGPDAPVSSSGKIRILGVPSTMLFDYEAGDDIVALGGTFTRVPTTNVLAATYIDRNGVLKYAGENLALRSEAFDNATWVKSGVTVAADSIAGPTGSVTADTLTATGADATVIQDLGSLTSAAFVGAFALKRKTGTGVIQLTLDGGSTWTTKTLTTKWQRFYITQTLANPDIGIRIRTSGDAIYATRAHAAHGSTPTSYVPTTSAANGAPRDGHFVGGYRTILKEDARTNSILRSQEFDNASWIKTDATVTANAAIAPDGTLTADKLVEAATNGVHDIYQAVSVTTATPQAASFFAKAAERTWVSFNVRGAGTSYVNLSTGAVGTTAAGHTITVAALANGWYRIEVRQTSNGVINYIEIQTATADGVNSYAGNGTSGIYLFGADFEVDQPTCSSYIPTTSAAVTRATELLYFPYASVPGAVTMDALFYDYTSPTTGDARGVMSLGGGGAGAAQYMYRSGASALLLANYNGAALVSSSVATATTRGDLVEARATISSTGVTTQSRSLNAGAETSGSASAANSFAAAFNNARVYVGGDGLGASTGTYEGFAAFRSIRVMADVQTLATIQAIVYDSGQLNQYPTSATAETIDGMNVDHALVIPSTQTAFRYVSVQVDDESNSAGYLDLPMLVVAGGWQPTINMATGAAIGFDTDSSMAKTDGGARIPTERPVFRTPRFTVPRLPESEGMTSAADMIRICGLTKQIYWFWDPTDTSANYLHRRSMLCTLRQLSPLVMPEALFTEVAFELEEEL